MRKVIAATFVSLDGVMQAPGGPDEDREGGFELGGWTFHYFDEVLGQALDELFAQPFDLLLGRKTYDIFAAYWPRAPKGDSIGDAFNAARKWVATRSPGPLAWENSVAIHDAAADVARLKQEDGPTLLIQGSSVLIQSLLAADLIDEFRLQVFPVLLGKGKRLFEPGAPPMGLRLADSRVATTGAIVTRYERAGEVRTGSFALPQEG